VLVVGIADDGTERVRLRLGHGADPEELLAEHGLRVSRLLDVTGTRRPYVVELHYAVGPGPGTSGAVRRAVHHDAELGLTAGERPVVFQRVAVYALLRSERGLLLTQMSDRTNSPGTWGPVGGGLDARELPAEALHREAWEESGQRVDRESPARVTTSHWVGRAPHGRLEDFHAVRLVYDAWCDAPTDPVVHDVGGTTAAAAWFRPHEVAGLAYVSSWAAVLADLVHEHPPVDGGPAAAP
jgi:8-oxo-dGTP pyrophosphatase MutT (NUDIX family)